MVNKNIKTASLNEIKEMQERGELHHDPDAPVGPDLDADFWANAKVVLPIGKKSIHLRIDQDVLDFFKRDGKGHLTRMNAVLRRYMEAQVSKPSS